MLMSVLSLCCCLSSFVCLTGDHSIPIVTSNPLGSFSVYHKFHAFQLKDDQINPFPNRSVLPLASGI